MKEPILIILALFVLVGLAYDPIKNGGLKPNTNTNSTSTSSSIGKADVNIGKPPNKKVAENTKIEDITHSPYYGKIRMSNIFGLYQNDSNKEYIYLSTSLKKNETVKITGWYLKSEVTGYYVFIGKAALLPLPFTKIESDVVVQSGDQIYLTRGFSPIGISFRTNKCTGYFEENQNFVPKLALKCPLPIDEKLPSFSSDYGANNKCLDAIDKIPRCTTVDNEFIRDLPYTVISDCKTYMTYQINYNGCVARHLGDIDFLGKEYRLYLNKLSPIWLSKKEKIVLYDQNGLIVDSISY